MIAPKIAMYSSVREVPVRSRSVEIHTAAMPWAEGAPGFGME